MNAWAVQESTRIKALSDPDLITEVHNAMNGSTYSWHSIHQQLQKKQTDYSLFREWSHLCDLKRDWEADPSVLRARHSGALFHAESEISGLSKRNLWRPHSYRALLLKLKLLPICAGLGIEGNTHRGADEVKSILKFATGVQLMSKNIDGSHQFTVQDLWLDCEKWGLSYIGRKWEEGSLVDEEEPLLGYAGLEKMNRSCNVWSWRKWVYFHRSK
jgi:hypothetical protein